MSRPDLNAVLARRAAGTGNLPLILHELRHALDRLIADGTPHVIDLGTLPMSPAETEELARRLGRGEVSAVIEAEGRSEITETAFPGIWHITHRDPEGRVNIADMVALNRSALAAAGLMPAELRFMQEGQEADGTIFGADEDLFRYRIADLEEKLGFPIPLDKDRAEVLLVTSGLDIHLFRDATGGAIETLHHMGVDYTLRSDGYEGANFGLLSGHDGTKKKLTNHLVDVAIRTGVKVVIVPECGHSYPALRFYGAEAHGAPIPFEVMTVSEYFGRAVMDGRLKLEKAPERRVVALHDPCKVGRWGGVFDEPRAILEAIGWELHETESNRAYNFCCGGGAGNFLIESADQLKRAGYRVKMNEIEKTGATSIVVSCGSCRMNFEVGKVKAGDSIPVESLAALIAAHLPKDKGAKA